MIERYLRKLLIWTIILVVVLYFFLPMVRTPTPGEELSYSQFLSAVQSGRVAEVTVEDQAVTGHLKDGVRFRTFVPSNDTSYLALAQSHNVQIIVQPKPKSTLGPLLFFLGRILFVSFFVLNGIGHITQRKMLTGYAHSLGVPAAGILVPVAGVLVLTGSVLIGLGLWPDLGAILLVIFLVPVTLWVHPFWKMEGQQRQSQALNFWRNVSFTGVAIIIFSLSLLGPLPSAFPWALFRVPR
jgi:putative oxidoreductase